SRRSAAGSGVLVSGAARTNTLDLVARTPGLSQEECNQVESHQKHEIRCGKSLGTIQLDLPGRECAPHLGVRFSFESLAEGLCQPQPKPKLRKHRPGRPWFVDTETPDSDLSEPEDRARFDALKAQAGGNRGCQHQRLETATIIAYRAIDEAHLEPELR